MSRKVVHITESQLKKLIEKVIEEQRKTRHFFKW